MTREAMSKKLELLGIEEPSKEMLNQFMDSFNEEMKAKNDEIAALKGDREKVTALEKQVEELSSALSTSNEKASAFEKSIAERDAKIKGFEVSATKQRVAHSLGLSFDAVEFLKGDDEESIKASGEALKSLVGKATPVPKFSNEPDVGNNANSSIKKLAQSLAPNNS